MREKLNENPLMQVAVEHDYHRLRHGEHARWLRDGHRDRNHSDQ